MAGDWCGCSLICDGNQPMVMKSVTHQAPDFLESALPIIWEGSWHAPVSCVDPEPGRKHKRMNDRSTSVQGWQALEQELKDT